MIECPNLKCRYGMSSLTGNATCMNSEINSEKDCPYGRMEPIEKQLDKKWSDISKNAPSVYVGGEQIQHSASKVLESQLTKTIGWQAGKVPKLDINSNQKHSISTMCCVYENDPPDVLTKVIPGHYNHQLGRWYDEAGDEIKKVNKWIYSAEYADEINTGNWYRGEKEVTPGSYRPPSNECDTPWIDIIPGDITTLPKRDVDCPTAGSTAIVEAFNNATEVWVYAYYDFYVEKWFINSGYHPSIRNVTKWRYQK